MIHLRLVLLVVGRRERAMATLPPPRPRPRSPRTLRVLGTPGLCGTARHRPSGYSTKPRRGDIPEESSESLAPGWRHAVAGLLHGFRTDGMPGRRCSQVREEVSTGDAQRPARSPSLLRPPQECRFKSDCPRVTIQAHQVYACKHIYILLSRVSLATFNCRLGRYPRDPSPRPEERPPLNRSLPLVRSYVPSSSKHLRTFITGLFGRWMYLHPSAGDTFPE